MFLNAEPQSVGINVLSIQPFRIATLSSSSVISSDAKTANNAPTGYVPSTSTNFFRHKPSNSASISLDILSVSTTSKASPYEKEDPSSINHSVSLPSSISIPHLGIVRASIFLLIFFSYLKFTTSATASLIFVGDGTNSLSSSLANGTGERGPVICLIGAFNDEKTSPAAKAAISEANEHLGGVSSTTTSLPVFSTLSRIASSSRGLVVLGSIMSQVMPSSASA